MEGFIYNIILKDVPETKHNIVDAKQKKKEYDKECRRKRLVHSKEIIYDIINTFLNIINLNVNIFPVETQVESKLMCSRKDIRQEGFAQILNNTMKQYLML